MGGRPAIELRVVDGGSRTHEAHDTDGAPDVGEADSAWAEDEALARACRGESEAWRWLYEQHFHDVHRHVLYLQGDPAIAEDLTQETFIRAMKGIGGYRRHASFSTWLHRIALNVVRRHWRRTSSRRRTVEGYARVAAQRVAASPEDLHTDGARARALIDALDELPAKLREAFVLRDLLGMASGDAAQLIGISPGHLAVRGHRARARLRRVLAERGWSEPAGGDAREVDDGR